MQNNKKEFSEKLNLTESQQKSLIVSSKNITKQQGFFAQFLEFLKNLFEK